MRVGGLGYGTFHMCRTSKADYLFAVAVKLTNPGDFRLESDQEPHHKGAYHLAPNFETKLHGNENGPSPAYQQRPYYPSIHSLTACWM